MQIGGAEFVLGLSKDLNEDNEYLMGLKLTVYGIDSMETTQKIFEALSEVLLDLDSGLELAAVDGEKSHIN